MSREYVVCEHTAKPEDISELEPLFGDGSEYLLRVLLRDGDKQWGTYMTATAKELAGVLFAAVLAVVVLLPGLAAAQPRINGFETVGQFRQWPESVQVGYVLGFRSYATMIGVRCPVSRSNGEVVAALKYNTALQADDMLAKAVMLLDMRDGCRIPEGQ